MDGRGLRARTDSGGMWARFGFVRVEYICGIDDGGDRRTDDRTER